MAFKALWFGYECPYSLSEIAITLQLTESALPELCDRNYLYSGKKRIYYKSYGQIPGANQQESNLTWVEFPNTSHALLSGGAKEGVCEEIEKWFKDYFC